MAKSLPKRSKSDRGEEARAQNAKQDVVVGHVPYATLHRGGTHAAGLIGAAPRWGQGKVLGFFIVGFLLERPPGGGAVRQTLKVQGMPKGTKEFYPWLMHIQYTFFDASTGKAVERPLWIQFTDLYAFKKGNDWYVQVTGGWADKGDTTPWWGFVGMIGIATG